ncbi:endoplasmic oxidoreductin-1 [Marasmius crinis-equi]|uniref:Endoplasmic oxidoreductin-1 n=1 Tax=Marasmius crinis-equi TaxID=585013 RepID=A0ABR3FCB1_9AGAR
MHRKREVICLLALSLPCLADSLLGNANGLKESVSSKGAFQEATINTFPVVDLKQCQNLQPTGPIEATLCDYETLDSVKNDLYDNLKELVKVPFFRYLQMDLYRGCPFWDDNAMCTEPTCALNSVEEREVPEKWRMKTLSRVDRITNYDKLAGCYYRDSDFCYLEDPKVGEYFDLSQIPERYTGYAGEGARNIWRSIYQENCFAPSTLQLSYNQRNDPETCLEERVYYKVISGLHSSISTHICLDYLNHTTGEWAPNLHCYTTRVASYPERLEYIYLNAVLLLRAVARLGPHLHRYDYHDGEDSAAVTAQLQNVLAIAHEAGKFDERTLFNGINAQALKEEFKAHFRNVSRIMDCIDCDQCRLWGKVQTMGVATALKVLFELDETTLSRSPNSNPLQRPEIVALFNTLHRFTESLQAVDIFRRLATDSDPDVKPEKARDNNETVDEDSPDTSRRRIEALIQFCKECYAVGSRSIWSRGKESLQSWFGLSEPSRTDRNKDEL